MKQSDRTIQQAHMVERLLASRLKLKRQYFIQRIYKLWKPRLASRKLDVFYPSKQAIEAVASFASDSHEPVRINVAKALGSTESSITMCISTFESLLEDDSNLVRLNASHSFHLDKVRSKLKEGLLESLLEDPLWSIRWNIARALRETNLHDKAWKAIIDTMPGNEMLILIWVLNAESLINSVQRAKELEEIISSKLNDIQEEYVKNQLASYGYSKKSKFNFL